MTLSNKPVTLDDILQAISVRQPILNNDYIPESDKQRVFAGIGSLSAASSHEISFVASKAYVDNLTLTAAGAVFVTEDMRENVPQETLALIVPSPYLAYASTTHLFDQSPSAVTAHAAETFIHPTAQIASSAIIGNGVSIGAYSVIAEAVQIGDGTVIECHVHVDDGATIGNECLVKSHATIGHHCQVGNSVRIHAHASIGSEGFGFAPTANPAVEGWERIAQLGRVIIGDRVRIGSHTCIDRGAIEDTIIEDNVIIDNLVQIAHNVRIGAGTAIAANTGIAGSTTIGKRCIIAGAVGIVGHIDITDDVTLTSMTMVTKSIKKSGSYSSGTVAMPTMDWRRAVVSFKNMGKKK